MINDDKKRVIGKLIQVTSDKLVVELLQEIDNFTISGFDDIHYIARLGSYLMIPVHADYMVVEITGLRDKDFSSKQSYKEISAVDSKAKYLDVVPAGMLPQDKTDSFHFGVSVYPSLYSDVLYALDKELDRIFDVADEKNGRQNKTIDIGRSVIFQDYNIKAKLDLFFGGHVSILGNTGSGKSCTVASILQTVFKKNTELKPRGASFIIFDVNGEYMQALETLKKNEIGVKEFIIDNPDKIDNPNKKEFKLPHWFLNQSEWELLLRASEKAQLPVLRNALGFLFLENEDNILLKNHVIAQCILGCLSGVNTESPLAQQDRIFFLLNNYSTNELCIAKLKEKKFITECSITKYGGIFESEQKPYLMNYLTNLTIESPKLPNYQNEPFSFAELEGSLELAILYEEGRGNKNIRSYCSTLLTRLNSLMQRSDFNFLILQKKTKYSPKNFLEDILGINFSNELQSQITIINMNFVNDEIVNLVSSVIARMVFEYLRQAKKRNKFPVHFILEEAHRYIPERPSEYAVESSTIFERIAKEGRKYGIFLLSSSQRPSELSKTVLSQCANFIIHKIQNPEDLSHIRQMTPYISESIFKKLPSLPQQHALIFGNAVNLPATFKVKKADPTPRSGDTPISDLWYRDSDFRKELPSSKV